MNQPTKPDGVMAKVGQGVENWQQGRHRRRLRRAIRRAAGRFHEKYPQWEELLFDAHFLLGRGMPVIERHMDCAASTDAFDLALAWVEQSPDASTAERKSHLQVLTPIAADFLLLLEEELTKSRRFIAKEGGAKRDGNVRGGVGIPQPGRSINVNRT